MLTIIDDWRSHKYAQDLDAPRHISLEVLLHFHKWYI